MSKDRVLKKGKKSNLAKQMKAKCRQLLGKDITIIMQSWNT